jgi:hypothetical protein
MTIDVIVHCIEDENGTPMGTAGGARSASVQMCARATKASGNAGMSGWLLPPGTETLDKTM